MRQNLFNIISSELINSVVVYDYIGKVVLQKKYSEYEIILDTGKLNSGIYFIRINGLVLKKIIKN